MYAPRKQAGFTMLELMIVITVVGIAMAAAAPAFGAAFVNQRTLSATRDVVRIGRRAYWEAVRFRRAHLVRFMNMEGPGGNPGRVELIRGDTNSCVAPGGTNGAQTWQLLRGEARCGGLHSRCIDWVDLSETTYQGFAGSGPLLTMAGGATEQALCYRPDGTVAIADDLTSSFAHLGPAQQNTLFDLATSAAGGLVFQVQAYDSGDSAYEGVQRQVLFPMGAPPRNIR